MSIKRAHELFSKMYAAAESAKAVEALATASYAQQHSRRSVHYKHHPHPRLHHLHGGYAKALAASKGILPDADPEAVASGRQCLPPESDRD